MDVGRLNELIAQGETLTVEFKSDRRKISDKEIYEEVVALANTSGGVLLIGVEDDGAVSGAKPRHDKTTDPIKLKSAIFNNTVPNVNTSISIAKHPDGDVIAISVEPYPEACATASGKSLHRTIGADGKPQTVPFYPRDQRSRRVDLGLLDFSAQTMENTTFDSFDPIEFERLRQTIKKLRGDAALLDLSNKELAKALRLVESHNHHLVPNVAGLLLLGREDMLRDVLPTNETHFQVLDSQGNVKVNDVFHGSLLKTLYELETRFAARNEEREINVGMFRLPVPDYSPESFREAVNNAILHRDYTRLDAVYIQWQPDHLRITNPGGFPEGINLNNLLVHEPKPRNPRLAETFKRIGLVEQTGRGVDKIFMGQLRYGRPAPDYSHSDGSGVRVVLYGGEPSLQFAAFVYEQDKGGAPLSLDELMVLNALFLERQIDSESASKLIQKGASAGKMVLERLHERGLIEARGEKRGRAYHLAAALYKRFQMKAEYVRAKGFEPAQQEEMIKQFVEAHGAISRKEVSQLCKLSGPQAYRILQKLVKKGFLKSSDKRGRGVKYEKSAI
jgi:ATP-dependent DNA helicase RecG